MMQVVMAKELIMDNSHNVVLYGLPILAGEKFTVVVLRENKVRETATGRKAYAHRIDIDSIDLPTRDSLYVNRYKSL